MAEKIIFIKGKKENENLSKDLIRNYCYFNDYQCVLELEINAIMDELKSVIRLLKSKNINKLVFLDFGDFGDGAIILDIFEKLCLNDIEVEIILQNIKSKKSTLNEILNAISNYKILNNLEVANNV